MKGLSLAQFLPQFFATIAANCGPFLFGISLAWSAPSGPKILSAENSYEITKNEFALAVAMLPLGATLSSVMSGLIRSRLGTQKTILIFTFPHFFGWLMITFANNALMLIIGRLLVGLAGGAYTTIIPVYIGEIASKEVRGVLLTLFQSSVDLGVLTVSIMGWKLELFTLNCIACVLVTIYPVLFMFFPETPVYLVGKGKKEEATSSLRRLRGADHDPESEISELQNVYEEALLAPKSSFSQEIKKKSTLKAFIIIMVLFLVFQFSGINAIMFYATSIFIESGIALNPFLASIILSIIEVFATIFSASIVDRFGRVALLKASLTLAFLGSMGIGSFFVMKDFNVGFYESFTWVPLPSLCIFVFGFSMGLATVPFILLGEVFSDEAKKIIAPLGQTTNNFLSVVIGLLFPFLVSNIGSGFTFFTFASFILFGFVFTVTYIPETKGKSLTEIQNILRS